MSPSNIDPPAPDAQPPAQSAHLSKYRLERLLGAGGMGSVYLARDLTLDRPVAIKFISPDKARDETARRRLIREARAAAALEHPNICGVHEVIDESDGRAFIVMQYIEGETLAAKISGGPLEVRQALSITADLASALAAAHKRKIVHRDVKPQNVMITPDGHAKLLDFGLAAYRELEGADTTTHLTTAGVIVGTVAYMSPEQAQQQPLDGRSDLFALGAVLFECLTGQRAFKGASQLETLHQVLYHDPPPPSSGRPELTPQVDELCRRLLAKHPDDRFQLADEVLGALRVFAPSAIRSPVTGTFGEGAASPLSTLRAGRRSPLSLIGFRPFSPKRAGLTVTALGVLALAGVGLSGAFRNKTEPVPPAPRQTVVAVMPFQNRSGDRSNDALAASLPAALSKRLDAVKSLRVLSPEEARDALREQPRADAAAIARSVGARYVLEGTIVRTDAGTEVQAALIGPDGQRRAVGTFGAAASVLELHQRVADGLITALDETGVVGTTVTPQAGVTENPEAFAEYTQARAFLERRDVPAQLDHAVKLFQSAIAKDPRFALAYAGLAEAYWEQFRQQDQPELTTKAMAANLEALKIDPAQTEVRMALAVMYTSQKRHEDAIGELNKVLELEPQNDKAHRLMSGIHVARGDWDRAISEAQQAASLRPSWSNYNQIGSAYFRAGRYEEAAKAYERVVELQPDSARSHQALGTALQSAGKNEEALARYEKAISILPSAGSHSNVGTLYYWRGDYRRAAENYEKAVKLRPNISVYHSNLGDAYTKLGQAAKAERSYRSAAELVEKLLAVAPNDSQQLSALAVYRAKLQQRAAALEAFHKAITITPKDGQVLYNASLVHALIGEKDRACSLLADALNNRASPEEARHADELSVLKGCPAYDRVVANR